MNAHRSIDYDRGETQSVVNVGAGAGSYEPRDRYVLAIEPSRTMRAQRPPQLPPAIDARAESLPLDDGAVDAAIAILTVHHWDDPIAGLIEMRRVARGTLNRPEVRNALSLHLSDELIHALERLRDSDTVKLVVIEGAGGAFCAGDDITEMLGWGNANGIMRRVAGYQRMANTLEELDKITIAAVDGYAVGGGLEITMACDLVIATGRAKWGMPEIDVGITPGWGGTTRMARLIGRRLTKEINLLGALHPARRAVELGLWNRVVADDQLASECDRLIEVLLSKNQQALRQLKFIINKGVEADLYTAQGFEALCAGLTGAVNGGWEIQDADRGGGIGGFVEKNELWRHRRELARDFWSTPAGVQTPNLPRQ